MSTADAERLPAASYASTVTVYAVLQVRAVTVVGDPGTLNEGRPVTVTRYPATPTLSLDAFQPSVRLVAVFAVTDRFDGADGADASPHAAACTHAVARSEWFPPASTASTCTWAVEPHVRPVTGAEVPLT